MSLSTPAWFADACQYPYSTREVDVAGCRINHLVWDPAGPPVEPTVVLVHGTGAHAHWWTHIAAMLAVDRRVVALDLSGHGDSAHRSAYSVETWADEVLAVVCGTDQSGDGVFAVGHSLGGIVAAVAARREPAAIRAVVQCETNPNPQAAWERGERFPLGSRRYYASRDEAVARFRPVPAQSDVLSYVRDRIAGRSVARYPEGWSWKYDTGLISEELSTSLPKATELLGSGSCPVAMIRCEHGVVGRDAQPGLSSGAARPVQVVELPVAGHHPMLDQPIALVAAIRALLTGWASPRPETSH